MFIAFVVTNLRPFGGETFMMNSLRKVHISCISKLKSSEIPLRYLQPMWISLKTSECQKPVVLPNTSLSKWMRIIRYDIFYTNQSYYLLIRQIES